jgi:hypothetical protein
MKVKNDFVLHRLKNLKPKEQKMIDSNTLVHYYGWYIFKCPLTNIRRKYENVVSIYKFVHSSDVYIWYDDISFTLSLFAQSQNNYLEKTSTSTVAAPVLLLTLKDRWEEAWLGSPVVADIDNNGKQEIIVPRANTLVTWNADGSLRWKFNDTPGRIYASPIVANFRDDTRLEIAFALGDKIFMLDSDGNVLSGFPVIWKEELRSLAAGDIDGDGQLDLVAATTYTPATDVMNAWHADGSQVAGFPPNGSGSSGCDEFCNLAGCYDQNIAIGDLDGDSKLDIVVPHDNAYASFHKGTGEAFDANAMFQYCTKTPGVRYLHDLALAQQGWTNNQDVDLQSQFTCSGTCNHRCRW